MEAAVVAYLKQEENNMITDLTQIIVPLSIYVAGLLTGFFVRDIIKDKTIDSGVFVLVIVTIMWTLSMFIDITNTNYETPTLVHGLMGAIVGFFYKPFEKKEKNENIKKNNE